MRIVSFGCRGYKAFKDDTNVEIRPLTLFIGKNNSGKSILLRLPKLLIRALAEDTIDSFPLESSGIRFGEVFQDLIYNRFPHGEMSLSIRVESKTENLDLRASILHVQDIHMSETSGAQSVVTLLEVSEPTNLRLEWDRSSTITPAYADHGPLKFSGILPMAAHKWAFFDSWRVQAKLFERSIVYLGPIRRDIPPSVRLSTQKKTEIDGAASLLQLASDDDLLDITNRWFRDNFDGCGLSLVKQGQNIEGEISRGNTKANLAYAGHGIHQLLPIVVQLLYQQKRNTEPRLILVEQPELHLHGAAETPLGDLFIDAVSRNNGTTVIVETHSENILLRIRRRIAERVIKHDTVALYWVEEHDSGKSSIRPINIDENGDVDWWPTGIFAEGYDEVRAIRRAQQTHRKCNP